MLNKYMQSLRDITSRITTSTNSTAAASGLAIRWCLVVASGGRLEAGASLEGFRGFLMRKGVIDTTKYWHSPALRALPGSRVGH
jgi:hypothetical protein